MPSSGNPIRHPIYTTYLPDSCSTDVYHSAACDLRRLAIPERPSQRNSVSVNQLALDDPASWGVPPSSNCDTLMKSITSKVSIRAWSAPGDTPGIDRVQRPSPGNPNPTSPAQPTAGSTASTPTATAAAAAPALHLPGPGTPIIIRVRRPALWPRATCAQPSTDGPFDMLQFETQPVILEKMPSLADGDVQLEPIAGEGRRLDRG